MVERIYIDPRTGKVVVVEEDGREDEPVIFHPVCTADELAWYFNVPGQLLVRGRDKR